MKVFVHTVKVTTLWLLLLTITNALNGQTLTVTSSTNATSLAQKLSGQGVAFSNATLNCPTGAAGEFTSTNTVLGLNSGILLTSGQVTNAPGPNNSGGAGTDNFAAGDSALTALAGNNTFDACILEFDLTVDGDSLVFNYVFASEEYDEYVCATVNDVFAFRISGPGVTGTPNIALIPGTTTPVSINTVNNGTVGTNGTAGGCPTGGLSNSAFYAGNSGTGIQYDGMTVVLQATIGGLTPCATYHMWLGVSDAGDGVFDSGVFLEEGSFAVVNVTLSDETDIGFGFENMVEGCVNGVIHFEIDDTLPDDYIIYYVIDGDAINGTDYQTIPDSIIIPSGDTAAALNILPIQDGIAEGFDTVWIKLANQCTGIAYDSIFIVIQDSILAELIPNTDTICVGDTVYPNSGGGVFYDWSPSEFVSDTSSPTPLLFPDTSTNFLVEISLGLCFSVETLEVTVGGVIAALLDTNVSCYGANDGSILAQTGGEFPPYTYNWNIGSGNYQNNLAPGWYSVTVSDALNCTSSDSALITQPDSLDVQVQFNNISCNGFSDGSISLTVSGGIPPYSYIWSNNATTSSINNLSPGFYSVTVTDSNSCIITEGLTITQPNVLSITTGSTNLTAPGSNDGSAWVDMSGGTVPYSISWSPGGQSVDSITNLTPGWYVVTVTDSNGCIAIDSAEVLALLLELDTILNRCKGDAGASLSVDVFGGVKPYTFNWSNSGTTDSIFNLLEGTYSLTVTDSVGNIATATVTIVDPSQLGVTLSTDIISCHGVNDGEVSANPFGGTPGYTYLWNNLSGTQINSSLPAGTYNVTVTDANGCSVVSSSSTLVEPDSLIVIITSSMDVTCFGGSDGWIQTSTQGGRTPYNYNWTGGYTNANITNINAGNYIVTVTDSSGCTDQANVQINQPTQINLSLANDSVDCFGQSNGSVSVSPSGGTPGYTYLWNPGGSSNPNMVGLPAGTYTVTVTDLVGCTMVGSTNVLEPNAIQITGGAQDALCFGGNTGSVTVSVNQGVSPYTYQWSNGNTTPQNQNLTTGSYILLVTDNNGCTATETYFVDEPTQLTAMLAPQETECAGTATGSIDMNVNGGVNPYSFQWSNGQNGIIATSLIAGTYTVTVTDANSCTVTGSATVEDPYEITLQTEVVDNLCPGDAEGSIRALGWSNGEDLEYSIDSINWFRDAATNAWIFDDLKSGVYTVIVRDDYGCTESMNVFIDEPPLIELFVSPDDTTLDLGEIVTLFTNIDPYDPSQIQSYQWTSDDGLSCSDCRNPTVTTYKPRQIYNLTVTYLNGCTATVSVIVRIANDLDVFIPNAFTPNGDGNNDIFTIFGAGIRDVEMTIVDRWGEVVYKTNSIYKGWDGYYKGEIAQNGVYVYHSFITYLDGKVVEKKGSVTLIR